MDAQGKEPFVTCLFFILFIIIFILHSLMYFAITKKWVKPSTIIISQNINSFRYMRMSA